MKKEQQEKETIRIKNSFGYSKSYDYSLGLLRRRQNLKKIFVVQERRVLCTQQRSCQKFDEDFSKQMWSSCIIQTLPAWRASTSSSGVFRI